MTRSRLVFALGLLLATVFLAAQLHCCFDVTSNSLDSHPCPVCHTVGAAIAISSLVLAIEPDLQRLEVRASLPSLLHVIFRSTTPRAPPFAA